MKKITVLLDETASAHFAEVNYSLDLPHKKTSSSDVVNHCFNECAMFEAITGDQITNWLMDNHKSGYEKWIKDNNIQQYDNDGKLIK